MNALKQATQSGRLHNRIAAVMLHIDRYDTQSIVRLAEDSGVSRSEISRLLRGRVNPSYVIVERVHLCLEKHAGRRLNLREIVSETGHYPTAYVCDLMKCRGCLPAYIFNQENEILPQYRSLRQGQWTGNIEPWLSEERSR
jgi:transcriptional regulator with XRE-family HTH domain